MYSRADELLAEILELEEELDRSENYCHNQIQVSQKIQAKRTELDQLRKMIFSEAAG